MFQSFSFLFGHGGAQAPPSEGGAPRTPRPKIGIALGGGAARGWAHIGVLKRLRAHGIEPDIVAGTSIGAVVGACWIAGKLDALEEFARALNKRRVLGLLDITLGGSGLIGGRRLAELLQRDLADTRIEALPRSFVAVATELGTGHEMWLKRGVLVDALRASYALPGIFEPVRLGGRWLIDGALVNPVPVSVCRALGARVVIAVGLGGEAFGRGATMLDPEPGEEAVLDEVGESAGENRDRPASDVMRRKLVGQPAGRPGLSSVVTEAFNITQDRIARSRLAGDPPDVMISPRLAKIGLFEFHRADDCIMCGEEAAERAIADIAAAVKVLA